MQKVTAPPVCWKCECLLYDSDTDTSGGLVALFKCGAERYWTRTELETGSTPVQQIQGCQGKPLPDFYLRWRWGKIMEGML